MHLCIFSIFEKIFEMATKQQKVDLLISEIRTLDPKKVKKAIKALEEHGNGTVIRPLYKILLEGKLDDELQAEVFEFLCSLKDTSTVVEIMDLIDDPEFRPVRNWLLMSVWNMKVDFSDYIDDFVQIATKGDLMEVVDCWTIIENMEGPFMEENILESQLHLKDYLENGDRSDTQKAELMSEIALRIKEIDMNLQD